MCTGEIAAMTFIAPIGIVRNIPKTLWCVRFSILCIHQVSLFRPLNPTSTSKSLTGTMQPQCSCLISSGVRLVSVFARWLRRFILHKAISVLGWTGFFSCSEILLAISQSFLQPLKSHWVVLPLPLVKCLCFCRCRSVWALTYYHQTWQHFWTSIQIWLVLLSSVFCCSWPVISQSPSVSHLQCGLSIAFVDIYVPVCQIKNPGIARMKIERWLNLEGCRSSPALYLSWLRQMPFPLIFLARSRPSRLELLVEVLAPWVWWVVFVWRYWQLPSWCPLTVRTPSASISCPCLFHEWEPSLPPSDFADVGCRSGPCIEGHAFPPCGPDSMSLFSLMFDQGSSEVPPVCRLWGPYSLAFWAW